MGYKTQYNNNGNYQKRSYTSNSGSNGGTAEMTSTKKDGGILAISGFLSVLPSLRQKELDILFPVSSSYAFLYAFACNT